MPKAAIYQNVSLEDRQAAASTRPDGQDLPNDGWTCQCNSPLNAQLQLTQTCHPPRLSAELEAWPGDERELDDGDLGPEDLSPEEQQERQAFIEQPMTDEEVDVWRPKQVWGDE